GRAPLEGSRGKDQGSHLCGAHGAGCARLPDQAPRAGLHRHQIGIRRYRRQPQPGQQTGDPGGCRDRSDRLEVQRQEKEKALTAKPRHGSPERSGHGIIGSSGHANDFHGSSDLPMTRSPDSPCLRGEKSAQAFQPSRFRSRPIYMDSKTWIEIVANFIVVAGLISYGFTLFAEYHSTGRWAKNVTRLLAGIGLLALAVALLLTPRNAMVILQV